MQAGVRIAWALALALLLSGCLGAPPLSPAGEESAPEGPEGSAAGDGAPEVPPGEASDVSAPQEDAPAIALLLAAGALAPRALHAVAQLALEEPLPAAQTMRIAWWLDEAALAEETLDWSPADGTRRELVREWPAPPGPAVLRGEASWLDATQAGTTASLEVEVPAGAVLVLNASAEYTQDVGQPTFRLEWEVPLFPWRGESGLDLLARAAETYSFPYRLQYHADLEAHYVEMVNGTEEVWVVDGFVSRSWMVLWNGTVAGSALDHVTPAAGDRVELRYVECYATGQCDGLD